MPPAILEIQPHRNKRSKGIVSEVSYRTSWKLRAPNYAPKICNQVMVVLEKQTNNNLSQHSRLKFAKNVNFEEFWQKEVRTRNKIISSIPGTSLIHSKHGEGGIRFPPFLKYSHLNHGPKPWLELVRVSRWKKKKERRNRKKKSKEKKRREKKSKAKQSKEIKEKKRKEKKDILPCKPLFLA